MDDIISIKTISDLHTKFGFGQPKHPLISLVDLSKLDFPAEYLSKRIVSSLYVIFMKDKCIGNVIYGRNTYNFQDGTLSFMSPEQSMIMSEIYSGVKSEGWGLFFHPDLIRRSTLSKKISEYNFFSYSVNEALYLSEKEKETIDRIAKEIDAEISVDIDLYSDALIISGLEMLLNYSGRFYGRQFITRENVNKELVESFEEFLHEKIYSENLKDDGIPTVKDCAEKMCLSPNYLSDLLKKETGKNTKEYIHFYVIDRAKNMPLNSNKTVNEIAYDLGFEYPEYFSKLFKKKTGHRPSDFRGTV